MTDDKLLKFKTRNILMYHHGTRFRQWSDMRIWEKLNPFRYELRIGFGKKHHYPHVVNFEAKWLFLTFRVKRALLHTLQISRKTCLHTLQIARETW